VVWGAWEPGFDIAEADGTFFGAIASMAASGLRELTLPNKPANGRPNAASFSAARKRDW
jgi:hypothetical protein